MGLGMNTINFRDNRVQSQCFFRTQGLIHSFAGQWATQTHLPGLHSAASAMPTSYSSSFNTTIIAQPLLFGKRTGCRTKIRRSRHFRTITPSGYLGHSWMMSHLFGERALHRPGVLDWHVPCEPRSASRLTATHLHGRLNECYTASYGKQSIFLYLENAKLESS
jgi:hypothetical protein